MVDDQGVEKHITISSMCHEAAGKMYCRRGKKIWLDGRHPKMRHGYDLRAALGGGRVEIHRGQPASGREIHMRAAAM